MRVDFVANKRTRGQATVCTANAVGLGQPRHCVTTAVIIVNFDVFGNDMAHLLRQTELERHPLHPASEGGDAVSGGKFGRVQPMVVGGACRSISGYL